MKAIVQDRCGSPQDVLELKEIDKPVVKDNEALVRVHAASVNPADWHLMRGEPYIARLQFGLRRPKDDVAGCDVAGQVEAVGKNVTMFQPGDEVFGSPFMHDLVERALDRSCGSHRQDARVVTVRESEDG